MKINKLNKRPLYKNKIIINWYGILWWLTGGNVKKKKISWW
jgi:hypothetical protein